MDLDKRENYNENYYLNLIEQKKFEEAQDYRIEHIPKMLYKFMSLNSIHECDVKLNNDKLNSLKRNNIWLSKYDKLNDPFEFNSIYINNDLIKKYRISKEFVEKEFKKIKQHLLICSLTKSMDESLPMWAHYANNHKGFCLGFEVIEPISIFPVLYESGRSIGDAVLSSYMSSKIYYDFSNDVSVLNNPNVEFWFNLIFHSLCVKDKSWKYENEYRSFYTSDTKKRRGALIKFNDIGLKLKDIYLGINMDEKYRGELIEMSVKKNLNLYQMYVNTETDEFKLDYRKL